LLNIKSSFIGQFLRIKSNPGGDAFNSSLEFKRKIVAQIPGEYGVSFYFLINCGQVGCENAGDAISIKIKDGIDGEFKEVDKITGRSNDDRWEKRELSFHIKTDSFFVCSV
jgi:hypothetical protein